MQIILFCKIIENEKKFVQTFFLNLLIFELQFAIYSTIINPKK